MQIIRHIEDYSKINNKLILAVGNFDGVHAGHQKIIKKLIILSKKYHYTPAIITFYPHTRKLPFEITTFKEKILALASLGIQTCYLLNLNKARHMSAGAFITEILLKLNTKILICGKDFHFGQGRSGNLEFLKSRSKQYDFKVYGINRWSDVSSTKIREILSQGDLQQANVLLGRPYSVIGTVIKGLGLARQLGFHTANVYTKKIVPFSGVYFTKVIIDDKIYFGATNVGFTPTTPTQQKKIEVHIFDFKQDIYGKTIKLEFMQKIRDEIKFDNLKDLKNQIAKDVEIIKKLF